MRDEWNESTRRQRWLLKESTDVNAELTKEHGGIVETEEENL